MSANIIALLLFECVLFMHCQEVVKIFRNDYQYIEDTETFYKFHTIPQTWEAAREICEFEGASLFYANNEEEAMAAIGYWNRTQPFISWIFVGISTPNAKEVFETVDGLGIWQVYKQWGLGQPNNYEGKQGCVVMKNNGTLNDDDCKKTFTFICKKTVRNLEWNAICDLPDQSYIYSPQGRCYKFHLEPRNWEDAVTICNSEQSYLAVINSDEEAEFLVNITKNAPKEQVEDTDFMIGVVHLGFKFDRRWRTVKGESLFQSGYRKWETGHPEKIGEKKCGSMFYNGTLNDIACSQKCFFICEHEPETLKVDYDFRIAQT